MTVHFLPATLDNWSRIRLIPSSKVSSVGRVISAVMVETAGCSLIVVSFSCICTNKNIRLNTQKQGERIHFCSEQVLVAQTMSGRRRLDILFRN
jgi:hypothetical protein